MIHLDQARGDGVLPDCEAWTVTAPRLHRVGVRPRAAGKPNEELAHRRAGLLDGHAASIGRGVPRRLAERFIALRAAGLDGAEAERVTFQEYLSQDPDRVDPANLYPAFVAAANPSGRRRHGVYYTPSEVVGAQVRLVDDVLRSRIGLSKGLADEDILIVDPATGSGSYPLAVMERAGDVRNRMRLYETMPGAATIARFLGLDVQECDALSKAPVFDAPMVVCLGNPPYRRASAARGLAEGFESGSGGVHLKNLFNDYVYFWRWALRTVFEARQGAGVVCFVTAASYLRGPAFVGMRQALRRQLDELWVIDLEGDELAAHATENVFPIHTPVAIALGLRCGPTSSCEPARVGYTRLSGTRQQKLAALGAVRGLGDLSWQIASGSSLVATHHSDYWRWPALTELFPWQISGAQLKRTWPIGPTADVLRERWRYLMKMSGDERLRAFGPTRDRDLGSTPPDLLHGEIRLGALGPLAPDVACVQPVRYAYRSFDRQWVIPDARLGDFMRPALWRVAGPRQIFLTSLLTNVLGPGPGVVATASVPDLDHFRGSFGARAVIPLWRDAAAAKPNASERWLQHLSEQYGLEVDAEALMAYCYALLVGRGYVRRFEEELRVPGPRVPLTRDAELFTQCATTGWDLLRLHTYRHVAPGEAALLTPVGHRYPADFRFAGETRQVQVGDGQVGPVPGEVWNYSVSGYPVIRGWLRQRIGKKGRSPLEAIRPETWTPAMTDEMVQLIWLVEQTLAMEPTLEALLDQVVSGGCVERRLVGGEELVGESLGLERL